MNDVEPLVIPADVENVAVARRFARHHLADAPPGITADLQLAVSELVTNAIEHGSGRVVTITVTARPPRFSVAVTSSDALADIEPDDEWSVAEVTSVDGRGLGIVREIADHVDVRRLGHELTITVTRDSSSTSRPIIA